MSHFLLELGVEELPAIAVEKALHDLREALVLLLTEAGILESEASEAPGYVESFATPRRLIVGINGLKDRQEDSQKEQRGPALKAAFDEAGNPSGALLGFCRSQGVDVSTIRKDDQYVWISKTIPGRATQELLEEFVPKAIRALTFAKTMRWGKGRMRFARPIRWIVAALDGVLVSFELEGIASGLESRGHRFYSPATFPASNFADLVADLRKRFVEPDPTVRRKMILDGVASATTGHAEIDPGLLSENVYLTEWPTTIRGEFPEAYLELPEAVLVIAMAKHEKMFPVRDEAGKLLPEYLFVRNSGEDESVRKGTSWVLNARFNDAKFFFDEDKKHTFEQFLEKTEGILFQAKLGTVRQRADRLSRLAVIIAETQEAPLEEVEWARVAGLYAKADLPTGLVSELPALQGVIGGSYARREGMSSEVAWAIHTHYDLSKNSSPADCSAERTAIRVTVADQLDKLAGYLGLGLQPSGSTDPYGLRRAATILIQAALQWFAPLPSYTSLFAEALQGFADQGIDLENAKATKAFVELIGSRYGSEIEARYDVLDAALLLENAEAVTTPRSVRFRAACLVELAKDSKLVQTATRPANILAAAKKKGVLFAEEDPLGAVDLPKLESLEGLNLYNALTDCESAVQRAVSEENSERLVLLLCELVDPINAFFDSTMMMVDDEEVRYARLTLLQATASVISTAGDFSKIVIA